MTGFVREARRRKVWITAVAYAALAIGMVELVDAVSEALLFPDWTERLVTFLLLLAFPVVMVLAWIFDIEAGGLRRTAAGADTGAPASRPGPHSRDPRQASAAVATRSPVAARTALADAPPVPPASVPSRRRRGGAEPAGETRPADPDRLKRAALGHVRHELRTPINAILGYSEMLLEDGPEPAVAKDLQRIHEAGRRLLGLVDGILDPSRLAGSIDREIASYAAEIEADLRTPINAVIGYAEMLIEGQREIGREVLVPDLERIRDAAHTLLAASADIVAVATQAPGAAGPAPPERVRSSTKLARDVVARIGESGRAGGSAPEGRGSLLVVDDNATNRDLLARQLARHGYTVAAAPDGAAALETLAERDFDLVLLDVIMPGLDGVETLRRIRGDERLRDLPVLMLSSLDEVESAIRCIEAGAEEYITKPVQPALLEARIAANLELRELRQRERIYRTRIEADAATIGRLLRSTFPDGIADRVRRGETEIVESLPAVAVLHCQVGGGPPGFERLPEFVAGLSRSLETFEGMAAEYPVDVCLGRRQGFLALAGRGTADGAEATRALARLALAFQAGMNGGEPGSSGAFRLGLHSGRAVAGVIGRERLRFDVWGEAVDTARSLATAADHGRILVTPSAKALLAEDFRLEPGRVVEVRGLGQLRPFELLGVGVDGSP
ncbi:MAG: response regulator [Gemmatimonadota bacterium]|nr:response regulator [Gemmatimonadota bacterium]